MQVVKKEIIKLLDVGIIYPILYSIWVSAVQVVLKKDGMAVVSNEKNELIPMRVITEWRVCVNNRRLNKATLKEHFPINQMLEHLVGHSYNCFLDSFSGYF